MSKKQGLFLLKQKITLSYFILVLVALIAGSFLYKGIHNLLSVERLGSTPNQKLYVTNELLTLIYDAESDARSYYLFRNKKDFDNYIIKLNEIKNYINLCFTLCNDNYQQLKSLQSIRELSAKQHDVIQKLMAIDHKNQQDLNYQRALDEIYIQAYEIMPPTQLIIKNTIIRHDSIYQPKLKSNFFGRFKNLFSNSNTNPDKDNNIQEEKVITFDTVLQSRPLPDSVVKIMKSSLDKLKMRDNYLESEVISTETQLLHSDRIILNKIREIVSSLENEELKITTGSISQSKEIIKETAKYIIWLAAISFVLIIIFLILIYRDITKNRHYNQMLETAKKNSDELVHVKEQFVAMMSHEIRTPLSSIIGFSEQLDKSELTEKQKQYLGSIRMSSDFLLSIVNDTLYLLKINAGKIRLDNVRFNPADIIRDVYKNFLLSARNKHIELIFECDPVLEQDVYGDPLRFRQVLINLAGNAIKFTDQGTVKIKAISLGQEQDKLKIRISFSDTGIGIPKEKQSLIFEEFVQSDGSVTRKYGGSGLGLAIANKIVQMSGGNITVDSTPGVGSEFIVSLDFLIAAKPNELSNLKNILKHKKILVVDDDETLLLLISSMLSDLEITSDTAINGKEALNKLTSNRYDLIFTDLNMPEMNGLELMKKIKIIDPIVPIVCITANSTINDKNQNSNTINYLYKPFKEVDFINKITSVLSPQYEKLIYPDTTNGNISPHPEELEKKPYILDEIIEFVGNEPEEIKKIVKSFVANSLITINEIQELLPSGNFEVIAGKAHKLIPLFKQFHLFQVVTNLELLERYRELNLTDNNLADITKTVIYDSQKIVRIMEYDLLS